MTKIDLQQYLKNQTQETCRAFIIYGPAMSGKTQLARRMESILGTYLFDLQGYFKSEEDLSAKIDLFRPRDLEDLLLGLTINQNEVIVDNIDFLLITWTKKMKTEFMNMIDLRLKSPDITNKTFIFMIQEDPVITGYNFTLSQSQSRLLPLRSIMALV